MALRIEQPTLIIFLREEREAQRRGQRRRRDGGTRFVRKARLIFFAATLVPRNMIDTFFEIEPRSVKFQFISTDLQRTQTNIFSLREQHFLFREQHFFSTLQLNCLIHVAR